MTETQTVDLAAWPGTRVRPIAFFDAVMRRFWAKVTLPDENGCMLWQAGLTEDGYGSFNAKNGRAPNRAVRAHRMACLWAHGDPPTLLHEAAHSCRNRHCVAPDHLRWATRSENQRDRVRDGTHVRGERCVTSKLTSAQVLEIRRRKSEGAAALAREFGVSASGVHEILVGNNWAHLIDEDAATGVRSQ